ncbi:MAG: SDR family oxidoreductase [Candidatus Brocadiaceae bacterium]|nr:SDR family oxidoreductase [Candidatus Brocadiaceae bacterium]
MNKYLIIGANGLIGRQVGKLLSGKGIPWEGTSCKRNSGFFHPVNILDKEKVSNLITELNPKVVFHCANLAGGVNYCQENPEIAEDFHFNATRQIGMICNDIGSRFVFVSTDYVFDGEAGPYSEDDHPNPLNLYGELKLRAEKWLLENVEMITIVRTTNVFGWDPETVTPNFIMGLYFNLQKGKSITVPSFSWGNPTYSQDLAAALIELSFKGLKGIFHVVGSDFTNRYEWAVKTARLLQWDLSLIKESKIPPEVFEVPRPLQSNLSTKKFDLQCDTVLHNLSDSLSLFVKEMRNSQG